MKKLTATQLKIIALVTMTIDHIGMILMNDNEIMRIIGRLSFPIFAYMIAEGCRYTSNRKNYFLRIFSLAALCQIVMYMIEGSLYFSILASFSLSILMIYAIDYFKKTKNFIPALLMGCLILFLTTILPTLTATDYQIDYGIGGIILVVLVYLLDEKYRLLGVLIGCVIMSLSMNSRQWFSLFALVPLYFYNGKKGNSFPIPYFFYIYYPLHLAMIYGIEILKGS